MKAIFLGMLGVLLIAAPAVAQQSKAIKPQEQKMAECASRAKGLKGDAFTRARDECLRGSESPRKKRAKARASSQQSRMAQCSARAKGLKGEAYQRARNECLRSSLPKDTSSSRRR